MAKDTPQLSLTHSISVTALLQCLSRGFTLLIGIALARLLGADGYGTYASAIAWVEIAVIFALLGLPRLLVRDITHYRHHGQSSLIHAQVMQSFRLCAISSSIAMLLAAAFALMLYSNNTALLYPALLALLLIPLRVYLQLLQSVTLGFKHIVRAQFPEQVIVPLLVLIGLLLASLNTTGLHPISAISISIAAAMLGLFVMLFFAFGAFSGLQTTSEEAVTLPPWHRAARYTFGISLLQVLQRSAPIIFLSSLSGIEAAGIYAVAFKAADLLLFAQHAINIPLSQHLAEPELKKNTAATQRLFTRCTHIAFGCAALGALLFFFSGEWLVVTLFGADFAGATLPLIILSAGAMINTCCGSVGILLIMRGHERSVFFSMCVSCLLLVILLVFFIPTHNVQAAAIAWVCSTTLWSIVLSLQVWRKLGIVPTIFAFAKR